jgi:hypothetical protein
MSEVGRRSWTFVPWRSSTRSVVDDAGLTVYVSLGSMSAFVDEPEGDWQRARVGDHPSRRSSRPLEPFSNKDDDRHGGGPNVCGSA